MLQPIINYANDAAGIEKTLRGLQGFVTIAIGLLAHTSHYEEDVEKLVTLRAQFALGRRYFRLLKWHPCWQSALRAATSTTPDDNNNNSDNKIYTPPKSTSIKQTLEVVKFAFLGMYFFLEMFTFTTALGITTYTWAPYIQLEANKCWFYSISVSIVLCFYNSWILPPPPSYTPSSSSSSAQTNQSTNATKEKPPSSPPPQPSRFIDPASKTQLVIDLADLIVPGAAVGWIPVGPITVGVASTVSTVITGRQIWGRVQREAMQKEKARKGGTEGEKLEKVEEVKVRKMRVAEDVRLAGEVEDM